jgi:Zn-dependent protease
LLQQIPALAAAIVLGFVVGITLHEAAHAYSAYLLGDDTAYRQGRVTLNPLKHLDPFGSIMLLLAGFGWGRPTPVAPARLKGGVLGPVSVALAGPASNLLIVLVCAVLFRFPAFQTQGSTAFWLLVGMAFVNALLLVLNLIPIPPLDGAKVIFPFLPRALNGFVRFMNQYGPYILLGLVLLTIFTNSISPLEFILGFAGPLLQALGIPSIFG